MFRNIRVLRLRNTDWKSSLKGICRARVKQHIFTEWLTAYPENTDAALLAILEPPSISFVGTSIVTLLRSLARVLSLALSAELCGRVPSCDLEGPQDWPLGCRTGGAEGDRRNGVLAA